MRLLISLNKIKILCRVFRTRCLEVFTPLPYSPVGLDPKLAKRALKDSLK